MNVSVIVPTINSEGIIEKNMKKLNSFLKFYKPIKKYEIVIAAQSSDDKTFDTIKKLKSKTIKPLFIKKRGKGIGLTTGIKNAKYEWIWMVDDDIPYNFEFFLNGTLKHIKECDIIIGSRYIKGSIHNLSSKRKTFSFFYRQLVRFLFSIKQEDIQAGIKLMKKEIFKKIGFPKETGYIWDTELLYKANKKKLKIVEVPVKLVHKANKLVVGKVVFELLRDIFKLFIRVKF